MIVDFSNAPVWLIVLLWPTLVSVLLLAWLLRRSRGSKLSLSGFGVKLEITDKPENDSRTDNTGATTE